MNCYLINKTVVPVGMQLSFEVDENSISFVFRRVPEKLITS